MKCEITPHWLMAFTFVAAIGCGGDSGEDTESTAEGALGRGYRTIKVLHWNIAGAAMNYGTKNVVDKLLNQFDERAGKQQEADAISISEGCRRQVEYLRDQLKKRGHKAVMLQFAPTSNTPACLDRKVTPGLPDPAERAESLQAGPAILILAGGSNGQNHYWDGTASVDRRTDRGMACITAEFGKSVRVCSAHLATNDDVAAGQTESMMVRWKSAFRDIPHVIAGDFNAPPDYLKKHAPSLYAPRGLFYEAGAKENKATHGEGKLDYLFMSKAHFLSDFSLLESNDMGTFDPWWSGRRRYSDHNLVYGSVVPRWQ
jgi:endonuclease/exonuclease/phosphatase family metal-dependent hydrolase